jgi:hypothetical protein
LSNTLTITTEPSSRQVLKRPGVEAFLLEMGRRYEVVIYTDEAAMYADPVINKIDPHRAVTYRLYRQDTQVRLHIAFSCLKRTLWMSDHSMVSQQQPAGHNAVSCINVSCINVSCINVSCINVSCINVTCCYWMCTAVMRASFTAHVSHLYTPVVACFTTYRLYRQDT